MLRRNISDAKNSTYSIIFDIPQGCKPQEFFEDVKCFLSALEDFNHSLISGVDDTIFVVSVIEDIEKGSLVVKLREFIEGSTVDLAIGTIVANDLTDNGLSHALMWLVFLQFGRQKIVKLLSSDVKSKEDANGMQEEVLEELRKKIPHSAGSNLMPGLNEERVKCSIAKLATSARKIKPKYQENNDEAIILQGSIADFIDTAYVENNKTS
jgi:hypothetical protein